MYRILVLDIPLNGETFECGEGDHVHCFVSAPPKLSITAIVKYLKGHSAKQFFDKHPEIRGHEFWGGHLWSHSYYMSTLGNMSKEVVGQYIRNQYTK
mgnify:CR=1 FL=1